MDVKKLDEVLKEIMELKVHTVKSLSHKTKVTQATIYNMGKGEGPKLKTLVKLAEGMNVKASAILKKAGL